MFAQAVASWALTTLPAAIFELELEGVTDDQRAYLGLLINAATADVEAFTGRRLKSRAYANANALFVRGDGTSIILVPEYPLTAVTQVRYRDRADGSWTVLDLTGMDFHQSRIEIPTGGAPLGSRVEVTCEAGYKAGAGSDHDVALAGLELVVLRIVQIKWTNYKKHVGMMLEARLADGSIKYTPSALPEDLCDALWTYKRV